MQFRVSGVALTLESGVRGSKGLGLQRSKAKSCRQPVRRLGGGGGGGGYLEVHGQL